MAKKYDNRKMRKNVTNEDLHLCAYAADKIKAIGFRLIYTSSCSEVCYYDHPNYDGMIRIAAHKFGRSASKADSFSHMKPVVSCITFGPGYKAKSYIEVDNYIALGLGNYMLNRMSSNLKSRVWDAKSNSATV